jgi:hypothetical protein
MAQHTPEEQRLRTLQAMQAAGLSLQSMWIRYFSIGGSADEFEVDAYLHGLISLTPLERNCVSYAVNELIRETPQPAAPYSEDLENNSEDLENR